MILHTVLLTLHQTLFNTCMYGNNSDRIWERSKSEMRGQKRSGLLGSRKGIRGCPWLLYNCSTISTHGLNVRLCEGKVFAHDRCLFMALFKDNETKTDWMIRKRPEIIHHGTAESINGVGKIKNQWMPEDILYLSRPCQKSTQHHEYG